MAMKSDLQKQLEAILGQELDAAKVQKINWWIPIASYAFFDSREGYITMNHFLPIPPPKICEPNVSILDACGYYRTEGNGKIVFRLSQFVCFDGYYRQPINVIAMPQSSDPYFLTIEHALVDLDTDVEIEVTSWQANGAAAPNVLFDWRCRVPVAPRILQGS